MDWNRRYQEQARWTRDLRSYLFDRAGLATARRVIEVGCGTGAVLQDPLLRGPMVVGVDIDRTALGQCLVNAPDARLLNADAYCLPFRNRAFEIAFCHYLLLWLRDPVAALREVKRVVAPGGYVLAIAEPDYTQRSDQPAEFTAPGRLQNRSLELQGADISIGSRLTSIFHAAGIEIRESGPLWQHAPGTQISPDDELEWLVLESDLQKVLPAATIQEIGVSDRAARREGTRRTDIPTYFAWGQV